MIYVNGKNIWCVCPCCGTKMRLIPAEGAGDQETLIVEYPDREQRTLNH